MEIMHFITILLVTIFTVTSFGKPVQISDQDVDGEAEDAEYEYAEEETALRSNNKKQATTRPNLEADYNELNENVKKVVLRSQKERNEDVALNMESKESDEDKSSEPADSSMEQQNVPAERQSNKFGEANERSDSIPMNYDFNAYMSTAKNDLDTENNNSKRKIKKKVELERSQENMFDNSYSNDEQIDKRSERETKQESSSSEDQPQFSSKNQYYDNVESRRSYVPRLHRRGRRQTELSNQDTVNTNEKSKEGLDDEEAAIRKHVKKLTKEELGEFLNSLSDDKRLLLMKIMDNNQDDSINKREITKKEGAALDSNCFNENSQIDSKGSIASSSASNLEVSPMSTEASSTSEAKETKPELQENISTSKSDSTENKLEPDKSGITLELNSSLQQADNTLSQPSGKSNIKREAKTDYQEEESDSNISETDPSDRERLSEEQPGPSAEEDLSRLIKDSESLQNDARSELADDSDAELADSIKSLEESFPNPISYGDSNLWADSDMVPLTRVKRKEDINYKKCEHIPYRAENDDEDNDEGSEFDDDGFYDRTSNIAKSKSNKKLDNENIPKEESEHSNVRLRESNAQNTYETNSNNFIQQKPIEMEKDNNLGSDSDSVLSGVGVDENMVMREKRSDDEDADENNTGDSQEGNNLRYNAVKDELQSARAPNYQENDAFGPLPRNSEAEVGRYKRIRRVKEHIPINEDNS